MAYTFLKLGALISFFSVALGAFAAHGLKSKLSAEMLSVFQTGVTYQMFHALGLILFGLFLLLKPMTPVWPGWLFVAGIAFFSGSLYMLALTGYKAWGAVTPVGGVLFLVAWISFGFFMKP